MKDNYDKICSENQQLNVLFTRQQKDKEKRRARDEALKKLATKPEWRKRNVRLWETGVTRGDGKTCNLKFLDYKWKSVRHILGTFSFHFLTHFFLCMYIVIMVYQRLFTPLNCTLILDIHCWYPMYSLRLAPQWFIFTSNIALWPLWFAELGMRALKIIGASLSKPHIDEFAVNFPYFYIYVVRCAVNPM